MMQSIAPTRSLRRRSRDLLIVAALAFLMGAALLVLGIGLHVFNLVTPFNPGYSVYDLMRKSLLGLGMAVACASAALALRALTWRTDNKNARILGEMLAARLDHRYLLIRNISQRTTGYVDAALLCHHGVLALRISNRRGAFFNEGGDWLSFRRGRWRPMRWNPTREAVAQASKLRAHFKICGLPDVPVFAVVVFLRDAPELTLSLRKPALPVANASQLVTALSDSYFAEERLSVRDVHAITRALYA